MPTPDSTPTVRDYGFGGHGTAENTTSPAALVVAECPFCAWRSTPQPIEDRSNGEWHARGIAAAEWREHFDTHRPTPRFLQIEATDD